MYEDAELEEQSQQAVAVETSRGLKLAKEKSSNKIDAMVALSIASLFAANEKHFVPLGRKKKKSARQIMMEQEELNDQRLMAGGLTDVIPESMMSREEL